MLLLWFLLAAARCFAQPANGVYREVYTNLAGSAVVNLTSASVYPNFPGFDEVITTAFEAPVNWGELFGQRMRALITAPTTGSYIFWVASDDNGELWLSTDENSTNRQFIASVKSNTTSRQWTKETNQMSLPISLVAGQRYYIEALAKEGTGGDDLAVRWQLPGGGWETSDTNAPIPATRLTPVGLQPPTIAQQPTNVSVVENEFATFAVRALRVAGIGYQWKRGGINIAGATNGSYSVGPLGLGDSGSTFSCVVTNWLGVTNSDVVTLTVISDNTAPTISSVANLGNNQLITLVYSEDVETASAADKVNYAINLGVALLGAQPGPDARTILLTTTPLAQNTTYTLTVNNVRDRASTPNLIAPNSQRTFTITPTPLPISMVKPQSEPIGPSSRRGALVISEMMYHPADRADGKNVEFIEIYNTLPWIEEMGGYKISGAIDYTFPTNFVLGARSFVVVAANPADLQSAHGIANVLGPWSGTLQNSSGTLRLHNNLGATLFEMDYTGDPPYPVAADGAGHSLVLARPSFGESDARAWAASDVVGGTPGTNEVAAANSFASIFINEFLAHTDPPDVDYIELFNYSTSAVNLVGCTLSDDPSTNKFMFQIGSVIPPMGFMVVYETNLGFALSASGEDIFLRNPFRTRIIDAVRFDAQENGVATGRFPDGAATFSRLQNKTPGTNNAPIRLPTLVFNEVMYHPISDNDDDEFIELYNPGTNALDVSQWRLADAVKFTMPTGMNIPAKGYLVIARNATRLRTIYPNLTSANCLGDWQGALRNGGERIALTTPDTVVSTNGAGVASTNTIHIVIDEVTYRDGGRWGRWSDGGGSSLELRDWRSDHRLPPSWGESDETAKSQWINIETTTATTNGYPGTITSAYQLHMTLMGAGECLLDNIEVIGSGGTNLVGNWTFETGTAGWTLQGNHNDTTWENEGYSSARSLHLRATGRGDTGANRVRTDLPAVLVQGAPVTLRAKVRWLKGNPNILIRLRGNWAELPGVTLAATRLGTPGAANTVAVTNAGPAITDVVHWPLLPATNQPVTVTARVHDPDGLAILLLKYRVDPSTNFNSVAMMNNGAGLFSGVIPGQGSNVAAAFFIQGADRVNPSLIASFPNDAPQRECVILWGDTTIPGTLPTYRFWITQTNIARWSGEEKMSNKPKDVTFIHGTNRIIYNAGAWFHGSPFHSPGYNSPTGAACDYDMGFPSDDRFLGETDINLYRPGNGGGDGTGQCETHANWFGYQMGVGFLFHRPVFMYVNGARRQTIFHDAQQPNGDWAAQWWPNDPDGELHKIQLGFEFGDQAYGSGEAGFSTVGANFGRYFTTGGAFHVARYRQTLPLRSVSPTQQNDYTNLYTFVNAVNTTATLNTEAYTAVLTNATDVPWWYRVDVVQHLYENGDSFSYGGGQNAFLYKPQREPWKLLLWDVDFAFGQGTGQGTNTSLLNIGGADHGPRNDHNPFRRIYWQTLLDAANTILLSTRSNPILDARYNGLLAAGAAVGNPNQTKNFIQNKRAVVLAQLATVASPFSLTSNNGQDFSVATNYITLSGTAPIDVRAIEINGITYSPIWTSITNWSLVMALTSGTNALSVVGRDASGNVFSGASNTIRVNVTIPVARPEDSIVINEIMYHPRVAGAEYIELRNRSTNTSFDLAGWRVDGIDYTFPASAIIQPRQFLVLAKDRVAYTNSYGANAPVFDLFSGNLQANGETITLIRPGVVAPNDVVIDKVRYDNSAPWPADADGFGSALQVVDAAQDNSRVGNWRAKFSPAIYSDPISTPAHTNDGWRQVKLTTTFGSNNRLIIYLDNPGSVLLDDIFLVTGSNAGVGQNFIQNGEFESPLDTNIWQLGTNMSASSIVSDVVRSGNGALRIVQDTPGSASLLVRDFVQFLAPTPTNSQLSTLSFWYWATNNTATNLTMRIVGSGFLLTTNIKIFITPSNYIPPLVITQEVVTLSPGASNSLATNLPPFPTLWINEAQADNTTGIRDNANELEPWIELYNSGTNALTLDALFLANNYTNLVQWAFPTGVVIGAQQFKLVFLDGETNQTTPAELHAPFRLTSDAGSVAISRLFNSTTQVVDYVNYTAGLDHSYGSFPDGQPFTRQEFFYVTPGATNNGTLPPVVVFINEWMADNLSTLADPADNQFEDWFEIYNPGSNVVSLAGYFLTDELTNKFQFQIPPGYSIPPHGHLLVWADNEANQNSGSRPDLHMNFNLSKTGEEIGLFTPEGIQIDAVTFGAQTTDVSRGRFQDGSTSFYSMTNPTPRTTNYYPLPNAAPNLAALPDVTILEGTLLSFMAIAVDTNVPAQQLTFSLDAAPTNVTIDAVSGNFVWQTGESDGGNGYLIMVRVTDNGTPPLSATRSFAVNVIESNTPPSLTPLEGRTTDEGSNVSFTVVATDPDVPAQNLAFTLDASAPQGSSIDSATGVFSWTPTFAQAPGVYQITIRVRDDGAPVMEDSTVVTITVNQATTEPLRFHSITVSNGLVRLPWNSFPGRSYQLEYKSSLDESSWTQLGTNIVADTTNIIVTDAIGTNTQRIYRIVLLP